MSIIALGPTVSELVNELDALAPNYRPAFHKTLFSMATPDVLAALDEQNAKSLVIFGIEASCLHV